MSSIIPTSKSKRGRKPKNRIIDSNNHKFNTAKPEELAKLLNRMNYLKVKIKMMKGKSIYPKRLNRSPAQPTTWFINKSSLPLTSTVNNIPATLPSTSQEMDTPSNYGKGKPFEKMQQLQQEEEKQKENEEEGEEEEEEEEGEEEEVEFEILKSINPNEEEYEQSVKEAIDNLQLDLFTP